MVIALLPPYCDVLELTDGPKPVVILEVAYWPEYSDDATLSPVTFCAAVFKTFANVGAFFELILYLYPHIVRNY